MRRFAIASAGLLGCLAAWIIWLAAHPGVTPNQLANWMTLFFAALLLDLLLAGLLLSRVSLPRVAALLTAYEFWLWFYLDMTGSTDDDHRWLMLGVVAPFGALATYAAYRWRRRKV